MEAGLWTEIFGHLALKPKGKLRFVDSTFVKAHQADQGAIGRSENQAIGLTKDGHNRKLTAAVSEHRHVVVTLLFTGQCAETTAAKQLLPFWPKPWVSSGTGAATPMNPTTYRGQRRPGLHAASFKSNQPPMVRSGILPQTTLGGKHLSGSEALAPRCAPLRETCLNLSRFLNTRVLSSLHATPIN